MTALMLSVVHAGRSYERLAELARVPLEALMPLEDRFADRLLDTVAASGRAACVIAGRPRAFIDLNRHEDDLDPATLSGSYVSKLSSRARHGLGLVPSRLPAVGALWRRPLRPYEFEERIAYYRAFHADLRERLRAARARHGIAVLLDIHSMPPLPEPDAADVVIGDRYGQTASREIVDTVDALLRAAGLRTAINKPYAGGAIVGAAGQPADNIHAVQLEFSRALYLDPTLREPGPGLARVQAIIATLVDRLTAAILPTAFPLAAE